MSSGQEQPATIRLLGSFEVGRGDRVLTADKWTRKKAATLLKRLALDRRLLKDQALEFLWPDADLSSAANNLYRTIHALRQTLNTALGEGASEAIFSFEDGVLSLAPSVWIDVHEFERLSVKRPAESPVQHLANIKEALSIYRGTFLPDDRYAEWTLIPREALYRRQRDARLELAVHYRDSRNFDSAIALLTPLLVHDRADEPVHRELMRIYALAGQRHEAVRQYQACVEALAADLDLPPSAETEALNSQILKGELAPPSSPFVVEIEQSVLFADKPRPLFVGRERELIALQSHLQEAISGKCRVIFITGEAGQGKTSLMAEFAYRAQADHPELIAASAACQALTGIADPYLPFRDLIAMLSGDWQRPWLRGDLSPAHILRLQAIAPKTVQAIAGFAPDLVDIIVPAAALPPQQPASATRDLNQRQVFEQMRKLIHVLAAGQPLLLLMDDLQWTDTASANLLFYLARQLVNSRVLIVGAYRPSEVGDRQDSPHPLAPLVQELVRYRGDIMIDLGTFAPAEGRNFVDALLDSEPNRLDATFREEMFRRTNGHPLFTVELLRALQDHGDLVQDDTGMWAAPPNLDWEFLPARVEAVIARRIDRLPPDLRQLLAVASVDGEIFSAEVIAHVQGMPVRPVLNQLSQDLDRHYRLVREQGEIRVGHQSLARYQFSHNLFQQYLYHQLSAAERRHLHAEIAAALEQICPDNLDSLAVTLAHHYLAAGTTDRAVPYLFRAGDDARQRVALEEAIRLYQSALTYWQADNPGDRAKVLHRLGESLLVIGRSQEAIDRFSEAERLYSQEGNRSGTGAVQRLIGRAHWEQGERDKALDHYQKALVTLEQEPENVELARAIGAIAQMHMLADEFDQAITWGERAFTLAQNLNTEDVIVHAMTTLGSSMVAKGDAEQGLAMLAESQERAEALGLPHDACRAYTGLGDSLIRLERYDQAREVYDRMLVYARKVGAEMFEGVALVQLAYLDWWTGHWKTALARRQMLLEWMASSAGSSIARTWASTFLGGMYNDLGQPAEARKVLAPYTSLARSARELQTTVPHLGQLARATLSDTEKVALIQEILAFIEAAAYPRYEMLPTLLFVCSWMVQTSGEATVAQNLLEKAHQQTRDRQSAASLYEVWAMAAGASGEWGQAISHFEAAAANWKTLQRPYDLLRTLAGLGEALVHTGDTVAVTSVQQQTAALIEQLANEITDPELKQAFLFSPLVTRIQKH